MSLSSDRMIRTPRICKELIKFETTVRASIYKYHTEIYSDLSKQNCSEIDPTSKVSINIDSWNRFTEYTNLTLFYYK